MNGATTEDDAAPELHGMTKTEETVNTCVIIAEVPVDAQADTAALQ